MVSYEACRHEKSAEQIGRAADAGSHKLQDVEPRTLQHHLLVLNIWLIVAIVFFYWFVFPMDQSVNPANIDHSPQPLCKSNRGPDDIVAVNLVNIELIKKKYIGAVAVGGH